MVSKQHIKFIKSLQYKKYRRKSNAFIVEGEKSVLELVQSDYKVLSVIATQAFFQRHTSLLSDRTWEFVLTDAATLARLGSYQSNESALAVAEPREPGVLEILPDDHVLALQSIRDPGNLGTMIRTADWYGFSKIIASPDTVDLYNPKVINATKGSFTRVQVWYGDIEDVVRQHAGIRVYGAFLEGRSLYDTQIKSPAVIVLGNESQGIRRSLDALITHRITIPRVGGAESLNVGIAAAIIFDHIRRQG